MSRAQRPRSIQLKQCMLTALALVSRARFLSVGEIALVGRSGARSLVPLRVDYSCNFGLLHQTDSDI